MKRVLLLAGLPLLGLCLGLSASRAAEPAGAQQGPGMSIAAVVNEDIITLFDVQSRIALVIATAGPGMENTPEMQQRLLPQVIDALIDDRLKLQEARRIKVTASEAEVRQAVENIEQRNNMPAGTFRGILESRNIDMSALYSQIEADVAWVKVVRQELQRTVNVAPEEVNTILDRLRLNQGKPEFLVAEIALPIPTPAQTQSVQQLASQLVQQARGGAPFAQLAQQFSQSATAALGGDLGWVLTGELDPEVDAVLQGMEPNQVSEPIRTAQGYHIISLRERRASGAPDPAMAAVTMSQIYLPTIGGKALTDQQVGQWSERIADTKDCDQMNKLAEEVGSPGSGAVPPLYVAALPPTVRDAVVGLKAGEMSRPIDVAGARLFVRVCLRRDDSGVPSPDQIYQNLESEKLQNAARQKLRDLRRQALVDVRL